MARPKTEHPTPAELEVLKILWEHGPLTVREVLDELNRQQGRRAYTSVMSLLNVMTDKRLVVRRPKGRAFVYAAKAPRERTLARMVSDLWQRAYEGSALSLVNHLLAEAAPTAEELAEIERTIARYRAEQGDGS